jgi:glutamate 5-kinase
METKIQAAEKVTEYGIDMLLANGGKEKALASLYDDAATGTLFLS